MNVLVTGATGFVGRALVLRLLREEFHPVALVNKQEQARQILGGEVRLLSLDRAGLVEALSQVQAVVDLAGLSANLIEALPSASSRPEVLVSTGGEATARRIEELGVRPVIIRIGTVLGLGGPPVRRRQAWIHLEDLVEVLLAMLADRSREGIYDAVAPALPERGFEIRYQDFDDAVRVLQNENRPTIVRVSEVPEVAYLQERRPRYLLHQRTRMAAPIERVFPFFADARNLGVITPPDMAFEIVSLPEEVRVGAHIDYRIRLGKIPMRWKTRIDEFEPGKGFVDCQLKGPYRSWWHEHRFSSCDGQTLMDDRVYYNPPLGPLGALANRLFIRRKLSGIFAYRAQAIRLRFSETVPAGSESSRPGSRRSCS